MTILARQSLILLLSVALLTTCSCARRCDSEAGFSLLSLVEFQRWNVETSVVSAPTSLGLEHLVFGWNLRSTAQQESPHLVLQGQTGRITLFSTHPEAREITLEAAPRRGRRSRIRLSVNGQILGGKRLLPGWQTVTLEIPRGVLRWGRNVLDIKAGKENSLKIRRLHLDPAAPHTQPAASIVTDTGDGTASIQMPTSSGLEAVLRLNGDPMLTSGLSLTTEGSAQPGAATISVSLLDDTGVEHLLEERELHSQQTPLAPLEVDLRPWAQSIVRLRVTVLGSGGHVLHLINPRISGCQTPAPTLAGPEPTTPSMPAPSGALGRPRTIALVVLDAARSDAFATFGGPVPSPAMDRLAGSGTLFSRAFSPASWTGQAMPALFTGLYPDTVGAEGFGSPLPDTIPTLAEILAQAGYRTVLWSQHHFYRSNQGLARGFSESIFGRLDQPEVLPEPSVFAGDEPLFILIHLLPPHTPYDPPAPFKGSRTDWYAGTVQPTGEHLNGYPNRLSPESLDDTSRLFIREKYHENVAFADHLLGQVLALLEESGRWDEALVAALSDHGEAFLEHGRFLHTNDLYGEFLAVPLTIKWPAGITGYKSNVNTKVSLVDLVPTIVDGLGLQLSGEGFQGLSLLPAILQDRPHSRPLYFLTRGVSNARKVPRPLFALEHEGWKAIYDPVTESVELYHLDRDPGELQDLAQDHAMRALALRQAMIRQHHLNQTWLQGHGGAGLGAPQLDDEVKNQLEALGYL